MDHADHHRLVELTWPEVSRRAGPGAVLAVPVGSTEQHGPHLGLATDTVVAEWFADALAGRRDDVLVAPAVPYGSSGEHQDFPGTLSVGREATRLLLVELVRSATAHFGRVLLVNGHGGNAEPVNEAVALLRREARDVIAWAPRFDGDAHAGRTETSLMLALRPQQVHPELAAAGRTEDLATLLDDLREFGVRRLSSTGVLGDPAGASAQQGHALLAAQLEALCARVAAWTGR